jgi:predicted ribosome quality control (RQC) complex YloA/Tae2 family protein
MKTEIFNLCENEVIKVFTFYIGENQNENFDVIDKGSPDDLWFHALNKSSCHVIAVSSHHKLSKKEKKLLITKGSLLCKKNTNSIKSLNDVKIIYTKIKNITKTKVPGTVNIIEQKLITI